MSIPPKFQLNISYGSRVIEFFLLVSAKLHIGSSSSRESTSSRGDNYNAYHKLAVALAEVWGSAISLGHEQKTLANFFYREFKSGVTGLNDSASQIERLSRMIKVWRDISDSNRDFVCLGDVNLCGKKWTHDDYHSKHLADMVLMHLLESDSYQIIKDFSRSEIVRGN